MGAKSLKVSGCFPKNKQRRQDRKYGTAPEHSFAEAAQSDGSNKLRCGLNGGYVCREQSRSSFYRRALIGLR
jgi:hypothetical protein